MGLWMLDINIASHVIKGDRSEIVERLASLPIADIVISSVTEGELFYGLAKRGYPKALSERVRQFFFGAMCCLGITMSREAMVICERPAKQTA